MLFQQEMKEIEWTAYSSQSRMVKMRKRKYLCIQRWYFFWGNYFDQASEKEERTIFPIFKFVSRSVNLSCKTLEVRLRPYSKRCLQPIWLLNPHIHIFVDISSDMIISIHIFFLFSYGWECFEKGDQIWNPMWAIEEGDDGNWLLRFNRQTEKHWLNLIKLLGA